MNTNQTDFKRSFVDQVLRCISSGVCLVYYEGQKVNGDAHTQERSRVTGKLSKAKGYERILQEVNTGKCTDEVFLSLFRV